MRMAILCGMQIKRMVVRDVWSGITMTAKAAILVQKAVGIAIHVVALIITASEWTRRKTVAAVKLIGHSADQNSIDMAASPLAWHFSLLDQFICAGKSPCQRPAAAMALKASQAQTFVLSLENCGMD
jgi:hypothetical protein